MSNKPAPKKTSVANKMFGQFQQAILDALSEPAFVLNIQKQTILAANAAAQTKYAAAAKQKLPANITDFFEQAEAENLYSLDDLFRSVTEGKRENLTLKPTSNASTSDAQPVTLNLTELPRYRNQKLFLAKLQQAPSISQMAPKPDTIAQNAPAPIIVCDKNGLTTWANAAFTKLTGYELHEIQSKEPQSFLFTDTQQSKTADPISASLNLGQSLKRDILINHKDGTELWTKTHFEPNVDQTGRLISYTGTFDDITKYRDFEKSIRKLNTDLAEEKNRFELALVGTNSGVWDWDLQENEVYYSARFRKLLGYSKDEFPNKLSSLNKILHPEDQPHAKKVVLDHLTKQTNYDIEYRLMTKAGDYRWFRAKGQAVWDEFGEPIRMAGLVSDISDHKADEEQIRRSAKTDSLTGLPNRTLFRERLTAAITSSDFEHTKIGLMLIDLDHFKDVNDTMGHPVGDELLRLVATRLTECVRDTDTVARLGGDEFAIIATDLNELSDIEILARRIVNAIAKPFYIEGYTVNTAASIGITLHPDSVGSTDDLLRFADVALYDAKDSGRSMFKTYDKAMNDRLKMRSELQSDMQTALKNDELELYYQPQINISTMQIIGAEALIRWNHPERGLVSPAAFIPIAETSRMLIPIGEWVIQEACQQTKIWHDLGFDPLVIGMNVSPLQFKHQDLLPNLFEAVTSSGVRPEWLEIEITEAATMEKGAIGLLHQLKDFGVNLSIDDFGTGYSSLSRLKSFPVDRLKIDRSFIREIERHQDNKAISSSIIQLGHSLNINVIAEGVETMDELTCLSEMGCDDVQGYLFARPMPAKDFETFLKIHNRAHANLDKEKEQVTRMRQVV